MFHCELESLSLYSVSPQDGRSGVQMPIGAKFSVFIITDTRTKQASYIMGTILFEGVKRPERGLIYSPYRPLCLLLW